MRKKRYYRKTKWSKCKCPICGKINEVGNWGKDCHHCQETYIISGFWRWIFEEI